MINNMKTILSAVKQYVESGLKKSVPNWNENNSDSINYITNRPFYDNRKIEEIDKSYSFTFDGNLEGREYIELDAGVCYVKLSDIPLTKEQLIGSTMIVQIPDGEDSVLLQDADIVDLGIALGIFDGDMTSVFEESSDVPFGVGLWGRCIPEQGVYFSSISNTIIETVITGNLKKIDEKYLPAFSKVGKSGTKANSEIFNDYKNNIASGDYSHAEGYETTAAGNYSHAESYQTTASGDYSHAESYQTTASGDYSHAEGYETNANGQGSHAEGYQTIASGGNSHAEGYGAQAIGYGSHAEGCDTTAYNIYSHAEGYSSRKTIYISGSGETYSFSTTGTVKQGDMICYQDKCAIIIEVPSPSKIKTNMALSNNTLNYAKAELKMGVSFGKYSHAEGYETNACGTSTHAEGDKTTALGDYSHAEGHQTMTSKAYSHAEGYETNANGQASHAEGYQATASGEYSHVEGYRTNAFGISAHAEGDNTGAYGDYSHAEGYGAQALGQTSHAEGYHTDATGQVSHAEGYQTIASGDYSHAEGRQTIASGNSQHVQGKYNLSDSKYAHIVGNGESDTARSNAHTLDWKGNAWFAGSVEGTALILLSPNGTRFNITVGDDGVLSATEMAE